MSAISIGKSDGLIMKATVTAGTGYSVEDEKIELYLPERKYEKPRMEMRPSKTLYKEISNGWQCAVRIETYTPDGKKRELYFAPESIVINGTQSGWGGEESDYYLELELENLQIVRRFLPRRDIENEAGTIMFWISGSDLLKPFGSMESSVMGEVKYVQEHRASFEISEDFKITFWLQFDFKEKENGDLVMMPYLVGRCETSTSVGEIGVVNEKYLDLLDDFLLISSFAERRRICCLGWEGSDSEFSSTYYRGNYSFPANGKDNVNARGLFEGKSGREFIDQAHRKFVDLEGKDIVRNALYSVIPSHKENIEQRYLSLFSGLESLVLNYRKNNKSEFVFEDEQWGKVRSHIKSSIKNSEMHFVDKEKRSYLYKNLSSLNRVPLQDVFVSFCKEFQVEIDDLWPVFGDQERCGLVEVRNKLAHGDPLPQSVYGSLQLAVFHLQAVLERMLLSLFGWDFSRSTVSRRYIDKVYYPYFDLNEEVNNMSKYLRSKK